MNERLKNLYWQHASKAPLSQDAKERVKDRIFQKLSEPVSDKPASIWTRSYHLKFYAVLPVFLILFVIGSTVVSANALPGDLLYPVKRQVESARVLLTPNPQAKLDLQVSFAKERLEEVEQAQVQTQPVDTQVKQTRRQKQQDQAKQDADNALKFLEKTKDHFQQSGDEDKASKIDDSINTFKTRFQIQSKVKGDSVDRRSHDRNDNQDPESRYNSDNSRH